MSRISTHVLDTTAGQPAAGIIVRLFQGDDEISCAQTDKDGRCANLLTENKSIQAGTYKLIFEVESYFAQSFYPQVTIFFKATEGASHYHIPLLLSPFGYTTYRGS